MQVAQLNGKQVKNLRCPRNGKQVRLHQLSHCAQAWEGDAAKLASPDTGLGQSSGNAAGGAWTVAARLHIRLVFLSVPATLNHFLIF